jgi:hypothetical protein
MCTEKAYHGGIGLGGLCKPHFNQIHHAERELIEEGASICSFAGCKKKARLGHNMCLSHYWVEPELEREPMTHEELMEKAEEIVRVLEKLP